MPIPETRVLIVLGTLLGAMTLASGLLLALEPAPVAARQSLALRSVDQPAGIERDMFDTEPPIEAQRYAAIVIRDSGTPGGGPNSAINGLYHFVIGNGQGAVNGAIVQVTAEEQARLDARERNYVVEDVTELRA